MISFCAIAAAVIVGASVGASVGSSGSGTPFWSWAGTYDTAPAYNGFHGGIWASQNISEGSFDFDWKADLRFREAVDGQYGIFPSELFASARWKVLELDLGIRHKERSFESAGGFLGTYSLSGGNIVQSGNARSYPGYTLKLNSLAIPFTQGRVRIRGTFGDYKSFDNSVISGFLIHNTEGYLDVDLTRNLTLTLGFDHYTQWGGTDEDGQARSTSFSNYLRMLVCKSAADGSYPGGDVENSLGNHLGRELVRLQYKTDLCTFSLQYDKPYEDKSGLLYRNFPDGIWTLAAEFSDPKAWISGVVYEFQTTMYQGGDCERRPATQQEIDSGSNHLYHNADGSWSYICGGADNYFNNYDYTSGWTNYGRVIGSPLFYVNGSHEGCVALPLACIESNRIVAHHLGITGMLFGKAPYKFLCTYSRHHGIYESLTWMPHVADYGTDDGTGLWQLSSAFVCEVPLGRVLNLTGGIYLDCGDCLPRNYGATVGIRIAL